MNINCLIINPNEHEHAELSTCYLAQLLLAGLTACLSKNLRTGQFNQQRHSDACKSQYYVSRIHVLLTNIARTLTCVRTSLVPGGGCAVLVLLEGTRAGVLPFNTLYVNSYKNTTVYSLVNGLVGYLCDNHSPRSIHYKQVQ